MTRETDKERETRFGQESNKRILDNMRGILNLLEENVNRFADPTKADVQTVYNLMQQRLKVKNGRLDLLPEEELQALDNLEEWFTSQKVQYPFPERIEEQRNFWKSKRKES